MPIAISDAAAVAYNGKVYVFGGTTDGRAANADVDANDCVNRRDLSAVLLAFGQAGSGLPEDVNEDGRIDDKDLSLVLLHFGEGC